jgi:hypothetical protein
MPLYVYGKTEELKVDKDVGSHWWAAEARSEKVAQVFRQKQHLGGSVLSEFCPPAHPVPHVLSLVSVDMTPNPAVSEETISLSSRRWRLWFDSNGLFLAM